MTTYNIFPHVKAEADERFGEPSKEALTWIAETYPNERKRGKTLNFEIIYGVGASKLGGQLGIAKVEAQQMIDNWFKGYPCVKVFNIRLMNEFRVNGFSRMLDGRPRHANMDKLNSTSKYYRGEEERTLQNAKIQGSAAAMAKKAMIRVAGSEEIRKTGYELLLQVHDELLGICPIETTLQAIELIRPIMEQPFSRPLRLRMPVSVGYGPSWASAKV
jgi:DNA polymerase-1